jgi:two-component system sensor histidine kinase YesM
MRFSPAKLLGFYRNLTIRNKLILVLYVQILIPLIFVGYLSYRNSEQIIKEKSTDYSRDILNMIQLRLGDYVNNLVTISQDLMHDLLYDSRLYGILNNTGENKDLISRYEYENVVNSHLKMVVTSRTEIRSISIVTNDGTSYYADDNSRYVSLKNSIPYEQILKSARKSNGKPVWYIVSINKQAKDIYLGRIISNRDDYKEIGLMVMQVNRDMFDSVYQGLTGNLKNIAILSAQDEQIASRDPSDSYLFSDDFINSISGGRGEKIDKKAGTFVSYNSLSNPKWKVVAYVPLDVLYKDAKVLRGNIIVLCVIAALLLSIISIFTAIDIVNPINRLVKGMKKVQKGESNVYVQDDRKDELGFLNKTFNEMSSEIHHLVNWVYREQLTRKEAELKALQSQINPHFLFNTLEAINWMAQLNNVPEISSTVSDLSDLMEASIGRDDRLITVEEEFRYADKYISLLKRRFEDRIELIKDVQQDVLSVKIPRLLIQPLIENAVYHGIEKSRGKGTINLNANRKDGLVYIEVIDNGPGMDSEELEAINDRLSMDNDTYFKSLGEKKRRSIGVENVNRRIKLFFGESFGLKIESVQGEYTKAVVVIPDDNERLGEGYYVQGSNYR